MLQIMKQIKGSLRIRVLLNKIKRDKNGIASVRVGVKGVPPLTIPPVTFFGVARLYEPRFAIFIYSYSPLSWVELQPGSAQQGGAKIGSRRGFRLILGSFCRNSQAR